MLHGLLALLPALALPQAGAPRDIRIEVDAREAPRHIFHAQLSIPVTPGPLTLMYPKWIPGEHGPTGPAVDLAGLKLSAGGKDLPWRRDLVDMCALHCEVPAGADTLQANLDYLSPGEGSGFTASPSSTAQLAVIDWHLFLLYPAGPGALERPYTASLLLPEGWREGGALAATGGSAGRVQFETVPLGTLADNPVLCGAHFRDVLLSSDPVEHHLDLVADSASALELAPDTEQGLRRLVGEAQALFGAHHYERYHFLWTLSDHVSSFGLEHHQCSDNRSPERTLQDPYAFLLEADLLPHEFVHSWNGKYRRPSGLITPDFATPMQTDLLWVYEGLTQYYGDILTVRSGLMRPEEFLEYLANTAAGLETTRGRDWRPLQDTADAAQLLYGARDDWADWRRGADFYEEGLLLWLEVDTLIRQQSGGQKSLDDFCRAFHGGASGPPQVLPYTFEDVVAGLNAVAAHDWAGFLRARLDAKDPHAPLGGIENGGWRLVYNEQPNLLEAVAASAHGEVDLRYTLGMRVQQDGKIGDVVPGSAADRAGIAPGMNLLGVNGRKWTADLLDEAVRASGGGDARIEMLLENADFFLTRSLDYHGGERHPHLERVRGVSDELKRILQPRSGG